MSILEGLDGWLLHGAKGDGLAWMGGMALLCGLLCVVAGHREVRLIRKVTEAIEESEQSD
ncbi:MULTISPECIES: hypothetical protein [unclassified Burkholderia]|uniref:hypothetical protein n=1 Tax=unclassified Burkholderia TaxID=2613784 RepID=UPI002AB1C45F|nr:MULTISPECIES: hypothetical protein [unclassified Burkholderia]